MSNDFPALLASVAGVSVGDEVTVANLYAGTTGKDVPLALASKAGLPKGTDVITSLRSLAGSGSSDANTLLALIAAAGGGGGFSAFSGYYIEWDVSNAATVTTAGGTVSQVDNVGATAIPLLQATGAVQPTYGTDKIGGLNTIGSTWGGGEWMAATLPSAIPQPFTVYFVVMRRSGDGADGSPHGLMGNANENYMWQYSPMYLSSGNAVESGAVTKDVGVVLGAVYNGASSVNFVNNAEVAGALGNSSDLAAGNLYVLRRSDGWSWNGLMGHGFIFTAGHDATTRQAVRDALYAKWSVTP